MSYYEKARYKKNPLTIKIISGSTACLHLLKNIWEDRYWKEKNKWSLYLASRAKKSNYKKRCWPWRGLKFSTWVNFTRHHKNWGKNVLHFYPWKSSPKRQQFLWKILKQTFSTKTEIIDFHNRQRQSSLNHYNCCITKIWSSYIRYDFESKTT